MVDFNKKLGEKHQQEAGQALQTTQEAGALAISEPTFNLPILANQEEAMEIIAENMADMNQNLKFTKVSIPGGGGISYEISDEKGNPVPVQKITGIILDKFSFKAWYIKAFDEKTEEDTGIPDCFSADNVHGSGCPEAGIPEGQLCKDCPKGQWGSNRKGGKGKDCADKIRVYILQENRMFPLYIDLPPSSVGNFSTYIQHLIDYNKLFYSVVTDMGLEKDTSGTIKYSKAMFNLADSLSKEEKVAIKKYIGQLKDAMRKITKESFIEETPVEGAVVGGQADEENPY